MKAFGVRLAAGAATILLGAIMAVQAQKDQQANADSAWDESHISPGAAVSPIGIEASSQAASSQEVETFKPAGEFDVASDPNESAVQLAQFTAPEGSLPMPELTSESEAGEEQSESSATPPIMKMRLPRFDDMSPAEATAGTPAIVSDHQADAAAGNSAGPSMSIKLPAGNESLAAESAIAPAKMSGVTFTDTPRDQQPSLAVNSSHASNASGQSKSGATIPAVMSGNELPVNDLRGSAAPPMQYAAENHSAAAAEMEPLRTEFAEVGGPALMDTNGTSDTSPSAMLSPVVSGASGNEPAVTLKNHREPPVQLEIGGEVQPLQVPSTAAKRSAATIGFASQPRIVGGGVENSAAVSSGDATYNQNGYSQVAANQVAGSAANQTVMPAGSDYGQAASGFGLPNQSVPSNAAANAPQNGGRGSLASGMQAPPLPSPAASGHFPAANPLPSASQFPNSNQGFAGNASAQPSNGISGQGSIYHSAGHKQRTPELPLPSGPTMASPGERHLDGPQSPTVVVHKRAPVEVKVGKPASFVITVKNIGRSKALNVTVHDQVPSGMVLTDATPRPNPKYQPELHWDLGDLEPNQERTITLQLTPQQEGELGSVARVSFQAAASVRTISTRPELKIVQKAPEKVLIGQQLEIELEVSNPGTGEATGVVLQEDVPAGLEHPQGPQLDNLLGTLGPGEVRRQILRMRAVSPGVIQNQIRVRGDDGLEATHTVAVEVVAPQLKSVLTGPSRRFLERQATYELEVTNSGTADATNVELSVQLDRGFTFVKTDYEGQYDASRHAVFWSLPALPAGQSTGKVPLTLLPIEEGDRLLRTAASADLGVKTTSESQVRVEALAELTFSINDSADPIEVGGQTIYEIRINNSGSRDDTNVRVALQLPQGMQLVEQGDFTPTGQGAIEFSPRALLKANDAMVYRVKAQGVAPGTHIVKAIVTSDQSRVPVTKEESITVYSDR